MIAEGTSASKNLVDSLLTLYSEFSEVQEEYRCELQDQSFNNTRRAYKSTSLSHDDESSYGGDLTAVHHVVSMAMPGKLPKHTCNFEQVKALIENYAHGLPVPGSLPNTQKVVLLPSDMFVYRNYKQGHNIRSCW